MKPLNPYLALALAGALGWPPAVWAQSTRPGAAVRDGLSQQFQDGSAGAPSGRDLRLRGTPISPSDQSRSADAESDYRPWSRRYGSFGAGSRGIRPVPGSGSVYTGGGYEYGHGGPFPRLDRYEIERYRLDRSEQGRNTGALVEERPANGARRGPGQREPVFVENRAGYLVDERARGLRDERGRILQDERDRYLQDERLRGIRDERGRLLQDERIRDGVFEEDRYGIDERYGLEERYGAGFDDRTGRYDETLRGIEGSRDFDFGREFVPGGDLDRRGRALRDGDSSESMRRERETLRSRGWQNLGGSASRFTGSNRAIGENRRTAATTNRPIEDRNWGRNGGDRYEGDWGTRAARRRRGFEDNRASWGRDGRDVWRDNGGRWMNENTLGNRSGDQGNRGRTLGNRSGDQGNRGRTLGNRSGDQGRRGRAFDNRSGDQRGSRSDDFATR